jgi:hypothetical protein
LYARIVDFEQMVAHGMIDAAHFIDFQLSDPAVFEKDGFKQDGSLDHRVDYFHFAAVSQFPGGADQKIGTIETVKIGNQAIKFFMKNRGVVYAGKKPVNRINNQTACPPSDFTFSPSQMMVSSISILERGLYIIFTMSCS